jgi:uridine kinase
MQEFNVIIITENENFTERVACGTRFLSLAQKYANFYKDQIVLAEVDKKLCELSKEIESDCELEFVTMTQRDGRRAYRRSVTFLLQKAVYNLWKNKVHVRVLHSLGESY